MDWRQLLESTYRNVVLADSLSWKATVVAFDVQNAHGSVAVAIAPCGGCVALVSEGGRQKSFFEVYTSAGSLVAAHPWPHIGLAGLEWPNLLLLVAVFKDGMVRTFAPDGSPVQSFNLFPGANPEEGVSLVSFGLKGFAAGSTSNNVYWRPYQQEAHTVKVASTATLNLRAAKLRKPQTRTELAAIAVVQRRHSDSYSIFIALGDGSLLLASPGRLVQVVLNCGQVESTLKIQNIIPSATARLAAFVTSDGFIVVASTTEEALQRRVRAPAPPTPGKPSDEVKAKATAKAAGLPSQDRSSRGLPEMELRGTSFNSPAIDVKQVGWSGDDCVTLIVNTPTPGNASQHCVLIGGPGAKWLDFLFPNWVWMRSELDGMRYVSPGAVGIIQAVPDSVESVFGPGSCDIASMLVFSQHQSRTQFSATELLNDSWGLTTQKGWTKQEQIEAERAQEEAMEGLRLCILRHTDVASFFQKNKWSLLTPDILMEYNRRRRKLQRSGLRSERASDDAKKRALYEVDKDEDNDGVAELLRNLSVAEIEAMLKVMFDAAIHEFQSASILPLLQSMRLVLNETRPAKAHLFWAKHFKLLRDFNVIFSLRDPPYEMLLTMREFQLLGVEMIALFLSQVKHFEKSDWVTSQYRLPPLSVDEDRTIYRDPWGFSEAYRKHWMATRRVTALESVRAVLALHTELEDHEMFEALKKRCGPILMQCPAVQRQAAWTANNMGRPKLAISLMSLGTGEASCFAQLYFLGFTKATSRLLSRTFRQGSTQPVEFLFTILLPSVVKLLADAHENQGEEKRTDDKRPEERKRDSVPSDLQYTLSEMAKSLDEWVSAPKVASAVATREGDMVHFLHYCAATLRHYAYCDDAAAWAPVLFEKFCRAFGFYNESDWLLYSRALRNAAARSHEMPAQASSGGGFLGAFSSLMTDSTPQLPGGRRRESFQQLAVTLKRISAGTSGGLSSSAMSNSNSVSARAGRGDVSTGRSGMYTDHCDLLEFQGRLIEICSRSQSTFSVLVGVTGRSRQRFQELAQIPWESYTLYGTGRRLLSIVHELDQGEELVKEFMQKFKIPKHLVMIWKIQFLASGGIWNLFLDCAKQAVQNATINAPNSTLSTLASLVTIHGADSGSAAAFSKFLRERYGSEIDTTSGISSTIASVFSAFPGRQTSNTFSPILPEPFPPTAQGVQQQVVAFCPNLLPTSSFSKMHVADFVSIAHSHGRKDIAVALVPYVNPPELRDRWAYLCGLDNPADAEKFCRAAISCAMAAAKSGFGTVDQSQISLVRRVIAGARVQPSTPVADNILGEGLDPAGFRKLLGDEVALM